ncbi:MAG: hypothetical protein ACC635_03565 [Acidiferrobacterales bacterium]
MLFKSKVVIKTLIFLVLSGFIASQLQAGEVTIKRVVFEKHASGWTVDTTLQHQDTGWQHYADAWRVVDGKGNILGTRTLFHPHVDEQPFTRSLSNIKIPAALDIVYVEAHDKKHGWSADKVKVQLSKKEGDRFKVRK